MIKFGLEEQQASLSFVVSMPEPEKSLYIVASSKEEKTDWMDGLSIIIGKDKFTSASMAKEVSDLLDIKLEIDNIRQQLLQAPPIPSQPPNLNFSK